MDKASPYCYSSPMGGRKGTSGWTKPLNVDKEAIRVFLAEGGSSVEAAAKFGVAAPTIRVWSSKYGWAKERQAIARIRKEAAKVAATEKITQLAESWAEKGERHRETVFSIAEKALQNAKLQGPKTWRDADIVDRMARRAAGLDNGEGSSPFINIGILGQTDAKPFSEG
jgi:transposase